MKNFPPINPYRDFLYKKWQKLKNSPPINPYGDFFRHFSWFEISIQFLVQFSVILCPVWQKASKTAIFGKNRQVVPWRSLIFGPFFEPFRGYMNKKAVFFTKCSFRGGRSKKVVFFKKKFLSKNFPKFSVFAAIRVFWSNFWTLKNDKSL